MSRTIRNFLIAVRGTRAQYSTGKTTFIKHLLNREYPGAHIGPEPTTDRFVVVMGGVEERRTPGNTLVVQVRVCR
jgi:EH domain-containing protein 1